MHANKSDELDKMDKFLGKRKSPKLSQEEIENLNRPNKKQGDGISNHKSPNKAKSSIRWHH